MSGLAELYFRPKAWEHTGRLYELLGVLMCKRVVLWLASVVRRDPSRPNNYFLWDRSIRGLELFERQTRHSEVMHLVGIAIPMVALFPNADTPLLSLGLWAVVLVNVHPFLLQRYNRARIYRVLERARASTGPPASR